MNKPPAIPAIPGIVNETTTMQVYSSELRQVDEQIAHLNKEKNHWPTLEWQERMHSLQRQRTAILSWSHSATRDSQLFPVAHQE
jgi:hypothetical protein